MSQKNIVQVLLIIWLIVLAHLNIFRFESGFSVSQGFPLSWYYWSDAIGSKGSLYHKDAMIIDAVAFMASAAILVWMYMKKKH